MSGDQQQDKRQQVIDRLTAKKGYKARIAAMCCYCIYDPGAQGAGSWRQQVENCTSATCPLHEVRPKSSG